VGNLQRKDAIQILREVISNFPIVMTYASLTPPRPRKQKNGSDGYQLKIGIKLDNYNRKRLKLMLREKHLDMAVRRNCVVIYKPQQLTACLDG
jgi:hypothetical protein